MPYLTMSSNKCAGLSCFPAYLIALVLANISSAVVSPSPFTILCDMNPAMSPAKVGEVLIIELNLPYNDLKLTICLTPPCLHNYRESSCCNREFKHRERERQRRRETCVRTGERTRCFVTM